MGLYNFRFNYTLVFSKEENVNKVIYTFINMNFCIGSYH